MVWIAFQSLSVKETMLIVNWAAVESGRERRDCSGSRRGERVRMAGGGR